MAYAALIFAVDHPRIQGALAEMAEGELGEMLQTKVEIGRLELGLFNAVELHDVKLHDRSDRVMLESKLIYAKLKLLPLLKGKVFLRNIVILDADINLYRRRANEPTNLQFVIDTFKSKKKQKKDIDLTINSLIFRRCRLAYDEHYVTDYDESRFNPHHILLNGLDANLSLKKLSSDSLNLRVRHIAFQERSGATLSEFKFHLVAGHRKAILHGFVLRTPHSLIEQESITAHYRARNTKELLQTLKVKGNLRNILVGTEDIVPFIPKLRNCNTALRMAANMELTARSLSMQQFSIVNDSEGTDIFSGNVHIGKGKHGISEAQLTAQTLTVSPTMVQNVFENILQRPVPPALTALQRINFHGSANYHTDGSATPDHIIAALHGTFTTAAGKISTETTMKYGKLTVHVATNDFKTAMLAQHRLMPEAVSMEIKAQARINNAAKLEECLAEAILPHATFNGEEYRDVAAKLDYNHKSRRLTAQLQSDNTGARLKAHADLTLPQQLKAASMPERLVVDADVREFCPKKLNLTNRFGNETFAFSANADIKDPQSPQRLQANLNVYDFTLSNSNNDDDIYQCRQLKLQTLPSAKGQHLTLRSDFADLEYEGPIQKDELRSLAINTLSNILSGKATTDAPANADIESNLQAATFVLAVKDTEILRRLANVDIRQSGTLHANGHIGQGGHALTFSLLAPELSFGNFNVKQLSVFALQQNRQFSLLAKATKDIRNGSIQAELKMGKEYGERIQTDIEWKEMLHGNFHGKVSTASHMTLPRMKADGTTEGKFAVDTEFMPTQMHLNDSTWNFEHATVNYYNGRVDIRNFGFHSGKQHLLINGTYEKKATDPIVIDLHHLNLEYILALARLDVVEFGGHATGQALVRQLPDGSPWASATVNVPDLTFNRASLGNGNVTIGWDHANRDIVIDGDIREAGQGFTIVKGFVDPVHRELDLQTESLNTQLGFINKYTEGIFENIQGRATGHCRIHGGFRSIIFEGKERGSAEATIPVTGVTYRVENADIDIQPGAFVFKSADIKDLFQGKGKVTGQLAHEHIKNMRYDFHISGQNIRLYDKPRELDMPFFATANGSGKVRLHGGPGKMNAEMRLQTQAGSELTYILDSPEADASQLLKIRPQASIQPTDSVHSTHAATQKKGHGEPETAKTDINLYFEVDVDPASCLHLVTDDKSGDAITVYGEGPIQANYHNKSGFKMFGTYNIQRGTYALNIPMLAQRKRFDIMPGGQVRFYGDPMAADVNVKARYVVNSASLADLNIGTGFANNSTRVDCLVNIYGEVANMQFDLDFDLPNVSEDEKQMVHSLIASEEERTTQVLYLLGLGRFYAYNYTASDAGQNQSTLMMNSLLSSTLSSQLNSIISNAIGSSNWSFGTNISTGQMGWNDTEVEGLVSSRLLNNRLLINGNFGYSNRQATTTNFVGDFDMQYLITPKGTVSIRAYSETNDRYFTKSTLTTQGVGLQLKRDFTRFQELFTRTRKHKRKK